MLSRLLTRLILFATQQPKWAIAILVVIVLAPFAGIIGSWIYRHWDTDEDRGAIAIAGGAFGESYEVPEYLDQGWSESDSLWFYNTTQGSALLPYDFLLALEQVNLEGAVECERDGKTGPWFLCDHNIDRLRYLPQKSTFFNPDALPVGFVKETYQGKDYVGPTCAACHTGQVNFKSRALRIDGGPAMADMGTFLQELTQAMIRTRRTAEQDNPRLERFVERVLDLNNDYGDRAEIERDLEKWTNARELYNTINNSTFNGRKIEYGHARLDAFGRIYNRILQHTINTDQIAKKLKTVTANRGGIQQRVLTDAEIEKVLDGVGESDIILRDEEFSKVFNNLRSDEPGFPDLSRSDMLRVRDALFNPANAPVSYPFLWDIGHSDYVQWNGLASNATLGPLGRNTGEVLGVFAILDWHEDRGWGARFKKFSLAARISGQDRKDKITNFKSSVDLFNLRRIESLVTELKSPRWPFCRKGSEEGPDVDYYLPTGPKDVPVDLRPCDGDDKKIHERMKERGQAIYAKKCQRCHIVIDREAWDRVVVGHLTGLGSKQSTDPAMARNSVNYKGKSGNFKNTYQSVGSLGNVVIQEDAPVVEILSAAVAGVIVTPDADKWWPRRIVEWIYTLFLAITDNPIKSSIKVGDYKPDTTAEPYNSLLAYRARSLNGIWATAPYLHNGSVPSLYDLLLPAEARERCGNARPETFQVGAREFDPHKVGFKSKGYAGFAFKTDLRGNKNIGHEYGACGMTDAERWDLIEYLKSL